MSNIRDEMPVSVRHEGEWVGTYTVIDNDGNILDKYESHITCQFPENAPHTSFQINRYRWPDGKREEYQFPGTYRDKKSWFDTERGAYQRVFMGSRRFNHHREVQLQRHTRCLRI